MAENLPGGGRKSGDRKRKGASESPRPTMAFRVNPELYRQIKESAERRELSITEEIEKRLERSFVEDRTIADLRSLSAVQQDELSAFGTDPHEIAAVKAFAAVLRAAQNVRGKNWREGDFIPWMATEATRRLLVSQVRSPLYEGLAAFTLTPEIEAQASALGEIMKDVFAFPPLPELAPQDDPRNWTGRGRHVVTFKDKASGEIIETVTAREGEWDKLGSMAASPEFLAAVERLRPRRDEIEVEDGFLHVLKSEQSVWDAKPVELTGPEEAARLTEGQPCAITNRPAELFNRADFDEALNGKPRDDDKGPAQSAPDGDGPSGGAASPASARRRKVKA